MKPTGSNPTESYSGASHSSSSLAHPVGSIVTPSYLESPSTNAAPFSDITPSSSLPSPQTLPSDPNFTPNPRFSVFRLNRTALLVTTLVISFIVLVGLSSLAFTKLTSKQSTTSQGNTSPTSQYSVGSLPLLKLNSTTSQLQLGTADKLAINGQLLLNNTLVLSPTTTPATPTVGQLYYDTTTNQPYFYNGNHFISLQPTTTTSQTSSTTTSSPQTTSSTTTTTPTVTSLGGDTGDITLGQGLTLTAKQLDVASTLLSSLNASNITSGTLADARLSNNVTAQGNIFNGASQLVQLNASTQLPAISGVNLTNLNGSNIVSGTVADARLTTNVTVQGNAFNGASQLVQLTAGGLLPILNGSNLTNISASSLSGTIADSSLSTNVALLNATQTFTAANTFSSASNSFTGNGSGLSSLNGSNISSGTIADARLSTNVTVQGNTFNGASQLVQLDASSQLPAISGVNLTNLNGSSIASGTVADARLTTNVTLQGNTFNGLSQLVQTTAGGILPALSGANLTSLNGTNISSGTVADARLSANIALLNGTGPQTFTGNNTFSGVVSSPAYTSTVITGTAPFTVASTTKVTNLNADLLDGLDSTAFGDATAANQTTILNRIGTNVDAAGTTTLFARLNNIDTNQGNQADAASTSGSVLARLASLFTLVGTTADAASPTGTVFARFAQLFTYIGTPSDAASASGSLFAQVRDVATRGTIPTDIPTGLTLHNTYTTSQSGLSFPVKQVFIVLVGGGGGGGSSSWDSGNSQGRAGGGGGGGAVVMGWIPAPSIITIGAGGGASTTGGYSKVGALIAFGGGLGGSSAGNSPGQAGGASFGGSGAGGQGDWTGANKTGNASVFGYAFGGGVGQAPVVHSGAGSQQQGGNGNAGIFVGGGAGGNGSSGAGSNGGAGLFAGGAGATGGTINGSGGGGGYLGAGSNGVGGTTGTGGAGGLCGGGGGGAGGGDATHSGSGGAGGAGCALIYY